MTCVRVQRGGHVWSSELSIRRFTSISNGFRVQRNYFKNIENLKTIEVPRCHSLGDELVLLHGNLK